MSLVNLPLNSGWEDFSHAAKFRFACSRCLQLCATKNEKAPPALIFIIGERDFGTMVFLSFFSGNPEQRLHPFELLNKNEPQPDRDRLPYLGDEPSWLYIFIAAAYIYHPYELWPGELFLKGLSSIGWAVSNACASLVIA